MSEQIALALGSNKPTLFVFTYAGDCCETTKKFFDDYNQQVAAAVSRCGTALNVVWLDTAVSDEASIKAIEDLAYRYGVLYVPSVLLIGARGESLLVKAGPVVSEDLGGALKEALGGD